MILNDLQKTNSMYWVFSSYYRNGILLTKLFWPTFRKNCYSDWEKLLKFEAEGQEFAKILRSLKVSKSQKQIMMALILPKYKRNTLRIIDLSVFRSFFGRVWDLIICFQDLLTFRTILFQQWKLRTTSWRFLISNKLEF